MALTHRRLPAPGQSRLLAPGQSRLLALAALVGLGTLTACGSRADDPALAAARGLVGSVFDRVRSPGPATPAPDLRQLLSRDLINRSATPLIFVEIDSIGGAALLWRIATNPTTNPANETWQGEDPLTLTLTDTGLLRATRGFVFDLAASDIDATGAALATRQASQVPRMMQRVEGDLDQVRTAYTCEIGFGAPETLAIFGETRTLTPALERCSTVTGDSFENRYWIDQSGFAWVSEQWAGPDIGHIRIERLYR